MQNSYIQLKKSMNQVKEDYDKIAKGKVNKDNWDSQGRKINLNIISFEKLLNQLTKDVNYIKQNALEEKYEETINMIEALLNDSNEVKENQLAAIKENTKNFSTNFEMSEQEDYGGIPQGQEVVMDLVNNKEVLDKRREELENIHKTAALLKDTTDQMAVNVNKQGEMLDEIETNVITSKENAEKAKKEIVKADELSRGNRKKLFCLLFIILVAIGGVSAIILSLVL